MTTLTFAQALPFDVGALRDWIGTVSDLASLVSIETLSSSRVVIAAGATTPLAGYRLELLPETSFGITFRAPYLSGDLGEIRVLDPQGQTLVSVTDLPMGGDLDALLSGAWLEDFGANWLGSSGADTLTGGDGTSVLSGNGGNDSITGGAGFDAINGNMGDDTASGGAGDDWVVGGKDHDLLFGDAGDDIVLGNLGDDTSHGGAGSDIVRGGQGNDIVLGDAGDDWLAGDRGDDTLIGGLGADIFHTHGDAGLDRVTDFSAAEGDRVFLLPGTDYTADQVGADTVISMAGGAQMVLVGVTLSSLPAGWIFGA
ncbi:calcium-binding protein [Phenylobacterium sp. J367]|uniref:calcium-binding protein n=1 Tax=Phenylobacterium sp. J367 TaxID=2898435 RepID=UPI002151A88D|nr:calcium-binding protein [Phenylobacterium sp. J367]MCR5878895.1 hypothetical protein [Phenylobacterium sp. J367]